MKVISQTGSDNLALVYTAQTGNGKLLEFTESLQPPFPRDKKWILIVSTLLGCPVACPICDAGSHYHGKLSTLEIFDQIDFMVTKRFPDRVIDVDKFKIQFARMGDPAFNRNVLEVLEEIPSKYDVPGFWPSISSIAPHGTDDFFSRLAEIKKSMYHGRFQLQFSIHTTDTELRDKLVPIKKWDFEKIASYGNEFFEHGDRKITLNFALEKDSPVDPVILSRYFDPEIFLIKITPINPTYRAGENRMKSYIDPSRPDTKYEKVEKLRRYGYDVIVSLGEIGENYIGSNCGQYVQKHLSEKENIEDGYSYKPLVINEQSLINRG
ncbi:MAG: radical SAM protein [candidate division Zixibacteria bacterium]